MNRKHFIILLVLVVVIGGLGLWVSKNKSASWSQGADATGQKLLPKFPVNDVASVQISSTEGGLHLLKTNGTWKVAERGYYPADFSAVSEFIQKLGELKVSQREEVGPAQYARLELNAPGKGAGQATVVEIKDAAGKSIETVYLGKPYMKKGQEDSPFGGSFPLGRWVRVGSQDKTAALVSDPLSTAVPKADQWINKDFLKVEKVKSISVTPTNGQAWKITRETETAEWKLDGATEKEKLDASKVTSIPGSLAGGNFTDVKPGSSDPKETGLDQAAIAVVETFDGFVYTWHIGTKDASNSYNAKVAVTANLNKTRTPAADEKPEDKEKADKDFAANSTRLEEKLKEEKTFESWIYVIPSYTLDALVKPRSEILVKEEPVVKAPTDGAPPAPPGEPAAPPPAPPQ